MILATETRDLGSPALLGIALFGAVAMMAGYRGLKDPLGITVKSF